MLVAIGLLFERIASLAVAVLVTVIIALPLAAWTDRCERSGVPRPIGAVTGMLLGLGCFALIVLLLAPSLPVVAIVGQQKRMSLGAGEGEDRGHRRAGLAACAHAKFTGEVGV